MSNQKIDEIVEKIGKEEFECIKSYIEKSMQNNRNMEQNLNLNNKNSLLNSIFGGDYLGTNKGELLKGIALGAGMTYLLTNENAQKTLFGIFAKLQNMLNVGFEEMKERFEDAKAELEDIQ